MATGASTLSAYVPTWERSVRVQRLRPSSRAACRNHLDVHLVPAFGKLRLRDIRVTSVQRWIDQGAGSELHPRTLRHVLSTLRGVVNSAALRGECEPLSLDALELPAIPGREMRALSRDELERLAGLIDERFAPDVMWLGVTGVRFGEMAALLDSDVDVAAGTARIWRSVDRWGNVSAPKTRAGERTIELFAPAIEAFRAKRALKLELGLAASPLAFPALDGGAQTTPRFWGNVWRPTVLCVPEFKGLRPHDLRHSAASLMLAAGLDLLFVSKQLGHASTAVTQSTYSHWISDRTVEQRGRFESYFKAAR